MNKINQNLRFKSGIYCIFNIQNGKRYVGSSVDIYNRLHEHICNLNNQKSHNAHLQAAWNKYTADNFEWEVLEYCDAKIRFQREQEYISFLKPEYNLTNNVIANFGHSPTKESREKISNTLKQKYQSGEIQTYRQQHNWKECWVYDIDTYNLYKHYDCLADFCKEVNLKKGSNSDYIFTTLIKEKYACFPSELSSNDIRNQIDKNYKMYINGSGKYLVSENENGDLNYYRSASDCSKKLGISRSMIMKHPDMTKEDPYIPHKLNNIKIYYIKNFVTHAVHEEESHELLSGNIGESPKKENPEISKENNTSLPSYSVEGETMNRI